MADDDEVLPDEPIADEGAGGEAPEGQGAGEGDDESPLSAERSDASSREDDGTPEPAEGRQEPVTRGGGRVQRVVEERNALRDELAAMRAERQAQAAREAQQQQQWDEQAWQERWAVMTPEEKVNELYQRGTQQLQQIQQQNAFQMGMMRDQMAYEAKASVNPVYARYKDEVETQYNQYAQQGRFIPRETLLKQLLGEKALATATKATGQARKQGQKKIEAQTTRPSGGKGDATSTRGKAGDSAEKRLAGVEI